MAQGNARAARAACEATLGHFNAARRAERAVAGGAAGASLVPFLEAVDELERAREFFDARRGMRGAEQALGRTSALLASAGPHCEREFRARLVPPELRATESREIRVSLSRVNKPPTGLSKQPDVAAGGERAGEQGASTPAGELAVPLPREEDAPALAALAGAAHRAGRSAGVTHAFLASRSEAIALALERAGLGEFVAPPVAGDAARAGAPSGVLSPLSPTDALLQQGGAAGSSGALAATPGGGEQPPIEWAEETRRVRVWREAVSTLAARVLPRELALAVQLFGLCDSNAASGAFVEVSSHVLSRPLAFARDMAALGAGGGAPLVHAKSPARAASPAAVPERTFHFLDMITTLDEARAALRRAADLSALGEDTAELAAADAMLRTPALHTSPTRGTDAALAGSRAELAHAAASCVRGMVNAVKGDGNAHVPPDGNVHPLAAYAINFLRRLLEYPVPALAAAVGADTEPPPPRADLDALLADVCHGVADALVVNLEHKAEGGYGKQHALRALFLMNNAQYVVRHAKRCKELGRLLGSRWQAERKAEMHAHADEYRQRSFGRLLELLARDAENAEAHAPLGVGKVNSALDEIARLQRHWTVADASLRDRVRRSVARAVLPPYEAFAERVLAAKGKGGGTDATPPAGVLKKMIPGTGGASLRYTPAEVEALIASLFAHGDEAADEATTATPATSSSAATHRV